MEALRRIDHRLAAVATNITDQPPLGSGGYKTLLQVPTPMPAATNRLKPAQQLAHADFEMVARRLADDLAFGAMLRVCRERTGVCTIAALRTG